MLKTKVVQNYIPYKKLSGCILLSPPKVELGSPNICHFLNDALEWKSRFTLELNVAKNTDYIEKCFKQKLYKI